MKNNKTISLIMAITVLFSIWSFATPSIFAATKYEFDRYIYTVKENEVSIVGYNLDMLDKNTKLDLSIPSTIDDMPVTKISDSAFTKCPIKSLIIPSTVESIGYDAFFNSSILEEVTIPLTTTYYVGGFEYVHNIKKVTFTKGKDNKRPLLYSPWNYTGSDGSLDGGYYILEEFNPWKNVEEAVFEEGITEIPDGILFLCDKLQKVTLPTTLKCLGLSEYESAPPTGDFVKGAASVGVFAGCTSLKTISLPDGLEQINEDAFRHTGLEEITIPKNVKHIGNRCLMNCFELKTVNLNSVNLDSIGNQVFINSALEKINTPLESKLESIGKDVSDTLKQTIDESIYLNAKVIGSDIFYSQFKENSFNVVLGINVEKISDNTYKSGIADLYVLGKDTDVALNGWEELFSGCLYSYADSPIGKHYSTFEQWQAQHQNLCEIKFDANGGEFLKNDYPNGVTFVQNDIINNNFVVAQKQGYIYQGLSKNKSASTVEDLTMNKSEYLYAIYSANQYTLSFDANGGQGTMTSIDTTYDKETTLPLCTFERKGYQFEGWSLKSDAKEAEYTDGASLANLTTKNGYNVTLYAVWKIPSITNKTTTDIFINELNTEQPVIEKEQINTVRPNTTNSSDSIDIVSVPEKKVSENKTSQSKTSPNTGNVQMILFAGLGLITMGLAVIVTSLSRKRGEENV